MENRLKGKLVFITGASSGIGRATAIMYAKQGANLIVSSRRIEVLEELKALIEKEYKVNVYPLMMDVSKYEVVKQAIDSLPSELKKIDILVNNAGLALGKEKIHESEIWLFDTMIDTNVKGMLYVTRCIIPLMLNRGINGHIVNIGSTAAQAAYSGGGVYCASKAAVKTLSDGLRIDLIDTPIRVTNIQPGMVETNFSKVRFQGDEDKANHVYDGFEALRGEDVANTVIYATNLPDNVQIAELTVMPTCQASGTVIHRDTNLSK